MILRGHGLISEGAPHDAQGRWLYRFGSGGVGHARCSCGALSPELTSGTKRKQWHREHKVRMAEQDHEIRSTDA